MSLRVDSNWWKDLFDDIYLLTDARTVCDETLTSREVTFLEEYLTLHKSTRILDLCGGQGRHALELSRRGFGNVTVLDYSGYLLNLGMKRAYDEKLNTAFIRGDARDTRLPDQGFQFIMVMGSSFGYFHDDNENMRILREAHRLLQQKGTLLVDLPDRDHVVKNFKACSSHKINEDITVNRTRELGDEIIYTQENVLSTKRGCVRNRTYCIRLYSHEKISDMMYAAGFSSVLFKKDFMNRESEGDYGCMTNRMIVLAKKEE